MSYEQHCWFSVFCTKESYFEIEPHCLPWLQDYVATRWYRAPELCGSFFSKVLNFFSYYCFVKSYRSFFWFPPPSIFSLKCICYPDDIKLILLCSIHRLLICGALVAFLRRFWLGSLYSLVKMWFTSWIWWLISWACHQQILFHRYDLLFMEILRHVQYQA